METVERKVASISSSNVSTRPWKVLYREIKVHALIRRHFIFVCEDLSASEREAKPLLSFDRFDDGV